MLWLTLVLALAAVASAVFAFVQARAAVSGRDDALAAQRSAESARDEALELSKRATVAAEKHAEALKRAAPGEWSTLRRTGGHRLALTNTTGREATIETIEVANGALAKVNTTRRPLPAQVDHGDVYEFSLEAPGTSRTPEVKVTWCVHGESDTRTFRRTPLAY